MKTNKHKADQFTAISTVLGTARFGALAARACWVVALGSSLLWASPADAKDRPFKGRIDGSFVASPSANPTIYVGGAQASGNATHLGAFSKVTSDVTNIATGAIEGSFTMTAANRDQLTGVYTGFLAFGTTPGTFSWVLNATITGGTGRFLHATGQFVFLANGTYVLLNGVVHGDYTETFNGKINY